jgi:hypothetical protein
MRQTAALNQALGEYRAAIAQGLPAGALKSLAQQITASSALLGQAVSLPQAPAATGSVSAAKYKAPKASDDRLNTLA